MVTNTEIKESELILNSDGSIYHLNLKPGDIAQNIILVGDPDRVPMVSQYIDNITVDVQKREFRTITGKYKDKDVSVVSTGIGTDNIDIVINELDALVNIDLQTKSLKAKHTPLNFIRIGTSGALQPDIKVDSLLISKYCIGLDGLLHYYDCTSILNPKIENAFINQTNWNSRKSRPYVVTCSSFLEEKFSSKEMIAGFTATVNGFYGPQGRSLRLQNQDKAIMDKIVKFNFEKLLITNLEMETAGIYGLAKLLGHHACSLNAILANRANGTFSKVPNKTIDKLIKYTLDKI